MQSVPKIVITGNKGFIGTHLERELIRLDVETVGVDIKSGIDILDLDALKEACVGCTHIIHLAAISSVVDCQKDPALATKTNIEGTRNVLAVAKENKARVLLASSAAVYGENDAPYHSEYMAVNPKGIYAETKWVAEKACLEELEVDSCILRLFNVYGPGGHGFINKFCDYGVNPPPNPVVFNGIQIRDFIYITDVCNAITSIIFKVGNVRQMPRIINIGTGIGTDIKVIAKTIAETSKYPFTDDISYRFDGDPGVMYSVADTNNLYMFYKPTVGLLSGIYNLQQRLYERF